MTNYGRNRTVRRQSVRQKKRAKISVQEGGQEREEYSLIAEKFLWGTKALRQLHCSIQAVQCIWGTEAPNNSNIQLSGYMKRQTWVIESQLPLPGLDCGRQWYNGWGNSQEEKEKSTTGKWQWGELEGDPNRVLCLSGDVLKPRSQDGAAVAQEVQWVVQWQDQWFNPHVLWSTWWSFHGQDTVP